MLCLTYHKQKTMKTEKMEEMFIKNIWYIQGEITRV